MIRVPFRVYEGPRQEGLRTLHRLLTTMKDYGTLIGSQNRVRSR